MKKSNKGFFLLETIMVSTFIITVLLYLYIQFSNIKNSYDISFKYDSIQSLYNLKEVDKFINEKFGYSDIKDSADNSENKYIELVKNGSCSVLNFPSDYSYCDKLMENLNIKTLLFVSSDVSYLKIKMKTNNPYSNDLFLYLKRMDSTTVHNAYVLIAEFKDGGFANLKIDNKSPKCVRAKYLHTEKCNREDSNGCKAAGYTNGAKITYGSLGTKGTLEVGDAFDCDVDGDGNYNGKDERFYYVGNYYDTDTKEFNDRYAVLVYYSNVIDGDINNSATVTYNSENKNNFGPLTAYKNLPSTKSWKNIHLIKEERQLITENKSLSTLDGDLNKFTYHNKSSRLITYDEINAGCFDNTTNINSNGGLDKKCQFILENTKFSSSSLGTNGSWLETPNSSKMIWSIQSNYRKVLDESNSNNSEDYGVRPVIEIHKNDIDY